MSKFIEINSKGIPAKVINIEQITEVVIENKILRVRLSSGESTTLKMDYQEFKKLIDIVATAEAPSNHVSVTFSR